MGRPRVDTGPVVPAPAEPREYTTAEWFRGVGAEKVWMGTHKTSGHRYTVYEYVADHPLCPDPEVTSHGGQPERVLTVIEEPTDRRALMTWPASYVAAELWPIDPAWLDFERSG